MTPGGLCGSRCGRCVTWLAARPDGDSDGEECDFLKEWVGSDEFIKQICRGKQEQEEEEESAERPGLSTVKALGMGSFSLDQQVMNCLADSTWLNDEVINAYMALLSIRSAVRSTPAETSEDEADPEVDEERGSRARGETETGLTCEYFSSFFYALLRNAKVLPVSSSSASQDEL